MLLYGTPTNFNKVANREIQVPIKNKGEGIIGVLRILFTFFEVSISLIPGVGPGISTAVGLGFAGAQAGLTLASYKEGNIRSTGQLFGALAVDLLPALAFAGGSVARSLRTEAIVVETIRDTIETAEINRVYVRGTQEFKENLKVLKNSGVKRGQRMVSADGATTVSRASRSQVNKYRNTFIREQAKQGYNTADIVFDDFEVRLANEFKNATNEDRALLRNLRNSKNLLSGSEAKIEQYFELVQNTSDSLSQQLQSYIRNQGKDPRHLIDGLLDYTEGRKITQVINRIFASGESDWATKEFWKQVKNGKILKSSNFWTQAAQALNANDVGREIITKPFNALIRKNKEFVDAYRKKWFSKWFRKYGDDILSHEELLMDAESKIVKKYTFAGARDEAAGVKTYTHKVGGVDRKYRYRKKLVKIITKQSKYVSKVRKLLEKEGKWWGGDLVLGYRILQDLGQMKTIQIYFNKINTNATRPGSKNRGGKKEIIMPITEHDLNKWNKSSSHGSYYLAHLALSRGGRGIAYEIQSELFANFLAFVPLPALRNILSITSNFKSVGKDIAKGTYFKDWWKNFEDTIRRLWIHKVGKLAGSSLGIFGKGLGKEGQRFGLGVARGFQHSAGQKLGKFNGHHLLKDSLPNSLKGTSLRVGQIRIKSGRGRTFAQSKLSTGRYLTNLRRVGSIGK